MATALFTTTQAFKLFLRAGCVCLFIWSPIICASGVGASESIEESISLTASSHSRSAVSQRKIDQFSASTQEMVDSILQNDRQSNITDAYNAQLDRLIQSQRKEAESLRAQIQSVDETERAMLPLLNVMLSRLSDFVTGDIPFLLDERNKRVERLTHLLDRADVSVAEKYRQILEAYLVEVGYGRTIEAYSGTLVGAFDGTSQGSQDDRQAIHVNYLRVGRVALYYQSLHGQDSGLWLPAKRLWQSLDSEQNQTVSKLIQIALQQGVPELLPLPVPTVNSN